MVISDCFVGQENKDVLGILTFVMLLLGIDIWKFSSSCENEDALGILGLVLQLLGKDIQKFSSG
jgi:hypothetical protein